VTQPTHEQIAEGVAGVVAAALTAAAPLTGGATAAVLAALAPTIPALTEAAIAALHSGGDPVAAARAALARTTALDPGPLGPRADAIDAASIARVKAEQAEHAASLTRISVADVSVIRRLLGTPDSTALLTPEERASLGRLADHAAIHVGS